MDEKLWTKTRWTKSLGPKPVGGKGVGRKVDARLRGINESKIGFYKFTVYMKSSRHLTENCYLYPGYGNIFVKTRTGFLYVVQTFTNAITFSRWTFYKLTAFQWLKWYTLNDDQPEFQSLCSYICKITYAWRSLEWDTKYFRIFGQTLTKIV